MGPAGSSPLIRRWSESFDSLGGLHGPEWLQQLRRQAAEQFARSGLPDRKTEAWKYTPMRLLESIDPAIAMPARHGPPAAHFPEPLVEADEPLIDILDGCPAPDLPRLPGGVTLLPLAQGLERFEGRIRDLLGDVELEGAGRTFAALNTAFLENGLVLHVAEGVRADRLGIRWAFSPGINSLLHNCRLVVLLDRGAELRIVEQFQSREPTRNALNVLMQADLGQGARLDHVRLQAESEEAALLSSVAVQQDRDSRYVYSGFDLGGGLVRHDLDARLAGTGAETEIRGAFVLDRRRHVDNHVNVDHAAPGCTSRQFFRGVLGGSSRGVFNGRALIRAGADGSSVQQSNANLLLSPTAEMDTKPELEIYADEVEASHGATVGQLDESAVFYLRSRGLSEMDARRMLTKAFCRAVLDRLEPGTLAERLSDMLEAAMPGSPSVEASRG
jgi:Fe-S cluster assembly protein SufD